MTGQVPAQPTFRVDELVLRPWHADDAESARAQHDELIARWFDFPPGVVVPPAERMLAAIDRWHLAYLDDRRVANFLVEREGMPAGTVEVRQKGDGIGELSWTVYPRHRGLGVATRAVRRLIGYGFEELGLTRLEAYCHRDNRDSQWVATRAGMRFECFRRGVPGPRPTDGDFAQFAVLPGDPTPGTRESFLAQLNARMPRKRIIAQGLIRDERGRMLLCELRYKAEWDLPGGVVDGDESPAVAVEREIAEELGVEVRCGPLVAVTWLPPYRQWDDAMLFVFDISVPPGFAESMTLQPMEIRDVHWVDLEQARGRVAPYLAEVLTRLERRGLGGETGEVYLRPPE